MTAEQTIQNPEMIAIDWEIHQLIELERIGFEEAPNVALRRLLGLGDGKMRVRVKAQTFSEDWHSDGVTLKSGTVLRFAYLKNSKPIFGRIEGGKIVIADRSYDSLSSAANDLAVTTKGRKTRLNGWMFFSVQVPEGSSNWVVLDQIRKGVKKGA